MQFQDFLPTRIAALSESVGEAIARVHVDRFGLSRDEWRVLDAAARHDGGPTRTIQEATGLDKVAVSRAATALEDRGLIRRTEDRADRRIKIVHVTVSAPRPGAGGLSAGGSRRRGATRLRTDPRTAGRARRAPRTPGDPGPLPA